MVKIREENSLIIPDDVQISVKNRNVTVEGPRGTLSVDLSHLQLDFRVEKKQKRFVVIRWFGNKINIACINTALTIVRNMVVGVTKGYRFKIRCAYAHFPINVSVEGQVVEIRNFLGEKRIRRQVIPDSMSVKLTPANQVKDEIVLEGNDLAQVSREAALMHQLCLVKNKDIRKFLDGVYVQTKTNIVVEE